MADAILKPTHRLFQDLTGKVYGELTVMSFAGRSSNGKTRRYYWNCLCSCGAEHRADAGKLKSRHVQSCGCKKNALISARITKHGHCRSDDLRSPEHMTWGAMIQRCTDPGCSSYARYGGSGIKVCERWMAFENFLADMGPRPSKDHSIDRYPDNAGNYEPGNCRWATRHEQRLNMRDSIFVEFQGERSALFDLCNMRGLPYNTVWQRINKLGWSVERALSERVRHAK